jgi:uncharacterized protein YaeQ
MAGMSLRPTIHKASLDVSDLDRQYYATHALTIARHPSETDERMMVRLLAFALFAEEALAFGAGLSDSDEPDLWAKDLTGDVQLWVEIGQPDPRIVRKAVRRARQVVVLAYGRAAGPWWEKARAELEGFTNLRVLLLPAADAAALAARAAKSMSFHVLVQDGVVTFGDADASVAVVPSFLLGGPGPA